MGILEWFNGLGNTGKAIVVISGSATVAATLYGAYHFHKTSTESKQMASIDDGDEERQIPEKKVLVLGLEGAGKTAFLAALAQPESTTLREATKPTQGFNVICLSTEGLSLNIWEIGGSKSDYWPNFIGDANLLVYVVDASSPHNFERAKQALLALLSESKLNGVPVLLVTTKNDVPEARSLNDVVEALGLNHNLPSKSTLIAVAIKIEQDGSSVGLLEAKEKILQLCK